MSLPSALLGPAPVNELEPMVGPSAQGGMAPLLFVIIALFIGTATRYLLRRSAFPYTITLLLVGLLLGFADRAGFFTLLLGGGPDGALSVLSQAIGWAGHIDPKLILYVFLPALIFEAAFALHVHTFKRSFANAFILAVPGIVVALVLTGAFAMLLNHLDVGLGLWTWPVALMFGAIISATDPVAVVSILKELGASKKLGTLIEGESLLNDGTAIVIFMIFLAILTGGAQGGSPVLEFLRVALGGTAVGVALGWLIAMWLKRVFNDALFEITLVVGAAYLAFFVAEHMFHVSGVLAVVALGLMMAGVGRTRVSPQVAHFLHDFWELAAFIANTLIFLIVGIVVALRVSYTPRDLLILVLVYLAILAIRAVVIALFYPLIRRIGYGLTPREGVIAWWGGLRGAIGLALALIVAGEPSIDPTIRGQILSLTAGIVVLTSLINATTIKPLLGWLGLTQVGEGRRLLLGQTLALLRQSGEKEISKLKEDRFMTGADWKVVGGFLPEAPEIPRASRRDETLFETRKRLLAKEKESYWRQFGEGLLGPAAVQSLSDEIDQLLDSYGTKPLSCRKDLEAMWKPPRYLAVLRRLPLPAGMWNRILYRRLALSYDCARGFVEANEENLKSLSGVIIGLTASTSEVTGEIEALSGLEDEIHQNRIMGLTLLRNMKEAYPEVYHAIETQNASRSLLNHQMSTIRRLARQGRLEPADADTLESIVQGHMKQVFDSPPAYQGAEGRRILTAIPSFAALSPASFDFILRQFQEKIFPIDAVLVAQGSPADALYILVRGNARVIKNGELLGIIEPGSVVGAFDVLASSLRKSSVMADTPITALRLPSKAIARRCAGRPEVMNALWYLAGTDLAERLLPDFEPWSAWRAKKLKAWIATGQAQRIAPGAKHRFDAQTLILVSGQVFCDERPDPIQAPALVGGTEIWALAPSILFVLGPPENPRAKDAE